MSPPSPDSSAGGPHLLVIFVTARPSPSPRRTISVASPSAAGDPLSPPASGLPRRAWGPTHAFVSSAVRARDTWEAVAEGSGSAAQARIEDAVYTADADTALDLLSSATPRRRS